MVKMVSGGLYNEHLNQRKIQKISLCAEKRSEKSGSDLFSYNKM